MKTLKITLVFTTLLFVVMCGNSKPNANSMTAVIDLPTVQCGMCENTIESGLQKVNGISKVDVNIDEKKATVVYDKSVVSLIDIEQAISDMGYQANEVMANMDAYEKLPACCKLPE